MYFWSKSGVKNRITLDIYLILQNQIKGVKSDKITRKASGCEEVIDGAKLVEAKGEDSLSGCFSLGVMERMKSWGVM